MSLDPRQTRIDKANASTQTVVAPQLEPDFPYTKELFDPFHFNLGAEVDTTEAGSE